MFFEPVFIKNQVAHMNVRFYLLAKTLYCQVTINKERCTAFSTGIRVNPEKWDPTAQTTGDKVADNELFMVRSALFQIKNNLMAIGATVTARIIRENYIKGLTPPEPLLPFFKNWLDEIKTSAAKPRTLQTYRTRYNTLEKYLTATARIHFTVIEVDLRFANAFCQWMKGAGMNNSYINKNLKMLKQLLKRACRQGIIKDNALLYIEYLKEKPKAKIYLSVAELKKIENFAPASAPLGRVKDLFLFQCYTGLAYADLRSISEMRVKEHQGVLWLDGDREKSGSHYQVPLFPPAKAIWDKYKGVLPIISNQKYNNYIKQVVEMVGIEKNITTHSGRKTFGNMMESHGIELQTIADMLGHKTTRMTRRHYTDVHKSGIWKEVGEVYDSLSA